MKTPRLLAVSMLVLCACPSDPEGEGSSESGSTSSTTAPTTTSPGSESSEESTSPGTTGPTTSSTEESSSSAGESVDTTADESSSSTTEPVAFELTSPAFAEGEGIPPIHHAFGGNQSPQLDWVGAPAGTMSYAVFFHDITIDYDHSAIWNIPADATGLPQDVDLDAMPADVPGATQCRSWLNDFGYGGPGSDDNFYEFILYAIDVETIPEIDQGSSLASVRAAFEAHSLGTATLTGQSTGDGT